MGFKTTQNHRTSFKGFSFKTCIFTLIIFCNYNVFSQDATISDLNLLTAAYTSGLAPGTTITIADGTYSSGTTAMKFNGIGNSTNPITLKAQTPGGVKITNGRTLKIGGDYCIIDGLWWEGGNGASNFIEFRDGSNYAYNSTLQNCVLNNLGVSGGNPVYNIPAGTCSSVKHNWVVMYGQNNTVINCSFMNKITSGNFILAEYQFNASADGTGTPNTRCDEVGHKILNNYFYKYAKIDDNCTNSGDSEAIRIGTSEYQNVQSNALVQNNYFVEADGENEIITNKSKGNSYINNTFRRCRGSLVLRHGSHTTVNQNYFLGMNVEGTGGIRIVDSNQIIRNNYIQDCINVASQAQWNNGITFLGGTATGAVACTVSSGLSNGYQKVANLDLSNNSIVNTNAPLYYNVVQGTNDPLGVVNDNLIYFKPDYSPGLPLTPVINADYTGLGQALSYAGNEWKGADGLGATNAGFTQVAGITATPSGEIFTFTGTTKGADMGSYTPTTDAMVGDGIGACFVDWDGVKLTTFTACGAVVIPETLIVGSLSTFTHTGESKDVSVTANVSWTAATTDAWITNISPASGTGDATVSVTVTENVGAERNGTVTFTQTSGSDNIVRTLNVTQAAPPPPDPRDGLTKINPNAADVEVEDFNDEENIAPDKVNLAIDSIDKIFYETEAPFYVSQWSGNGNGLRADPGNKPWIIYDLLGAFDLQLVDIATSNGKQYKLEILVSSTDALSGSFTDPFGVEQLSNNDDTFKAFVLPATAMNTKYVKIRGNGQVANTTSRYTSIIEIEFYGDASTLSVDDNELANDILMYPNPAKNILTFKNLKNNVSAIQVYSLDGRKVLDASNKLKSSELKVDVSSLSNGAYIVHLSSGGEFKQSKMIVISH